MRSSTAWRGAQLFQLPGTGVAPPISLSPMPWRSRRIRRESANPRWYPPGRVASGGDEGRQLGHDLVVFVFDVDLEGFQDPAYQHIKADDGEHLDQLARR